MHLLDPEDAQPQCELGAQSEVGFTWSTKFSGGPELREAVTYQDGDAVGGLAVGAVGGGQHVLGPHQRPAAELLVSGEGAQQRNLG